jgi:hypothetical protein
MMNHFEVVAGYLTVTDTTRWDYFFGFRRIIKEI